MFADCHMHMVLDGVEWKSAIGRHSFSVDKAFVREKLALYRDGGYTYLRDGGDRWGVGAYAREIAPEYGISYKTPLAPIHKKGHYGGFIGQGFETLKEYAAIVAGRHGEGADFIKIMISGLMDFDRAGVLTEEGLPADEIKEMIHIAHEEGFAVMAHANGARVLEAAAEGGVDSVEHGAYADGDALAALAERGVIWVPTVSTVGNLLGKGRFPDGEVERILACQMENIAAFASMGGVVAPGTDAGAWAVPHGCFTEEMWLRKCGVSEKMQQVGIEAIMAKF